jgi:hypothetical protein
MRATVLRDPRLARHAGRFVWLEIDGENERNAAYLDRFPVQAYPSLLVIDPGEERPILKWVGSATAQQVERLLDDARRAVRRAQKGADATLAAADRAHAGSNAPDAIRLYREALAEGGGAWSHRGRAAEALVYLLSREDEPECAREGDRLLPGLAPPSSVLNVATTGVYCAMALPEGGAGRAARVARFEAALRRSLRAPGILGIDRAGAYEALHDVREWAKDEPGAAAVADEWWAFVVRERRAAKDARARAAYVDALSGAAIARGRPADALPALARDERDLPGDYDPPFHAARIHQRLGDLDAALADTARALAHAYGPRRLRIQDLRASILAARGDRAAERATLEAALAEAARLPRAQLRGRERQLEQRMKDRLAALQPQES